MPIIIRAPIAHLRRQQPRNTSVSIKVFPPASLRSTAPDGFSAVGRFRRWSKAWAAPLPVNWPPMQSTINAFQVSRYPKLGRNIFRFRHLAAPRRSNNPS